MRKSFKIILLILLIWGIGIQPVFAQQKVAVLNTEDDGEPPIKNNELSVLTAKLRDIARKSMPGYEIMTEQSIQSFLGSQKEMEKVCNEADGCLARIGRDIEADYIGQARISRFGKFFTIKMEIYSSAKGTLIGSFTDEYSADIYALLTTIEMKAPEMFKEVLSVASAAPATTNQFGLVQNLSASPWDLAQNSPATSSAWDVNPPAAQMVFRDSRDGKQYKAVRIGNQIWMAENLNYNAGNSKCGDVSANCSKYGRLYNWDTAIKACPDGWHLPTNEEWDKLLRYADSRYANGDNGKSPYKSKTAGKFLKSKSDWNSDQGKSGNGMDELSFAALPGGNGNILSSGIGSYGYWWTATESNSKNAYYRYMYYSYDYVNWDRSGKSNMYSVRCLKW